MDKKNEYLDNNLSDFLLRMLPEYESYEEIFSVLLGITLSEHEAEMIYFYQKKREKGLLRVADLRDLIRRVSIICKKTKKYPFLMGPSYLHRKALLEYVGILKPRNE